MKKNIDIVVVNWNSGILTKQAVAPYINYQSDIITCNVIVVDNASNDNSVSLLKDYVPNLIVNSQNVGFGKACNQGFENSSADYILLLNPDTISDITVLEQLTVFLEKESAYAVTGPKQVDIKGNTIRSCGRFPTFKTALFEVLGMSKLFPQYFTPAPIMIDWNHSQSRRVDHIMGSYMLIRKSVLDITGFMDDDYFVYWEDIDLSKRIMKAGFKSYFNFNCEIVHEGGASGDKIVSGRLFYSLAGRRIYWKKHLGPVRAFSLIFLSVLIEPLLRIAQSFMLKNIVGIKEIIKAYARYIKVLIKE